MGIPYSREINAAFEQVTPLVAAGFKVLRTTKNISIILAIIQVLTVLFLGLIFLALIVLIYTVNPDLEVSFADYLIHEITDPLQEERRQLITPWLRYYAHITLWGVIKTTVTSLFAIGITGYVAWRIFLFEQWVEDVEYDANVDANKALEDLEENEKDKKKDGKKGKQKAKSQADKILDEEGKK